jgi:hypothetical protein
MPQPNDSTDDSGTIETGTARLPAATPAAPAAGLADEMTTPALSEEDIEERQRLLGTRRRPAGPPLGGPEGIQDEALDTPADVPPTDVSEAISADPSREGPDNEGPEPFESSERV